MLSNKFILVLRQKWLLIVAVAVLVVIIAIVLISLRGSKPTTNNQPASTQRQATIIIDENKFKPATLKIKAGTVVKWQIDPNDDDGYKLAANPEPFDNMQGFGSRYIVGKDTYTYVFNIAGHYGYHNVLIPTGGGTIDVAR